MYSAAVLSIEELTIVSNASVMFPCSCVKLFFMIAVICNFVEIGKLEITN